MSRLFSQTSEHAPANSIRACIRCAVCCLAVAAILGCERQAQRPDPVVIYASVDQRFAQQVLEQFEQQTGIPVRLVPDSEANKTTGLSIRIREERNAPKADVWWSGEVFATIRLAQEGLLEPFTPASAHDIPAEWRDPDQHWTSTAARARVLAYDPARVTLDELPQRWAEVFTRDFAPQLALANPRFGTTRGQLAAHFNLWGQEVTHDRLEALVAGNVIIADGNADTIRRLVAGEVRFAATDTDDVWVAQERGDKIDLIYPGLDTLDAAESPAPFWIPCSVGLIKGARNPEGAKQLIEYLVSAEVERQLFESASRNVPVRAALRQELGYQGPEPVARDFNHIAGHIDAADRATVEILLR